MKYPFCPNHWKCSNCPNCQNWPKFFICIKIPNCSKYPMYKNVQIEKKKRLRSFCKKPKVNKMSNLFKQKNLSEALHSHYKKSDFALLSQAKKVWVCHCSFKLKNLSAALLSQPKKSECGTAQPSVSLVIRAKQSECGNSQPS